MRILTLTLATLAIASCDVGEFGDIDMSGIQIPPIEVDCPCLLPSEFCDMGPAHFDAVFNYAFDSMTEAQRAEWIYMIHNAPQTQTGFVSR